MTAEKVTTFSDDEKKILAALRPSESLGMSLIEIFNGVAYDGPGRLVDSVRSVVKLLYAGTSRGRNN